MLMLLVAAAACSDDDGDDSESKDDDSTSAAVNEACELFSEDDAEEVLGARDGKRVATAFVTPANEDAARAIVELALG